MSTTTATATAAQIRRARPEDAATCGKICWEAFNTVADQHRAPREMPPDPQMAIGLLSRIFSHPKFYCVVAEQKGRAIGSNCLDERGPISGVGPITVDPAVQNAGVGRQLMEAVVARSNEQKFAGCRLLQAGYHMRSLSLYTKLGFIERETVVRMQGPPIKKIMPEYSFRQATAADAAACNALCFRVHGHMRAGELADAIAQGNVTVAEHDGRLVGYTTGLDYFGHTVAESNRDLIAILAQAPSLEGRGIMVPVRNHEVFSWCLNHGLRSQHLNTLMTIGVYNEPQGAWLPSILY
ncbi:MAG: GNAT family N-acetyltransferase [Candidatus Acidiferrales bacterium]